MEIQNNRQLANQKRRIFLHYHLKDQTLPKGQKDPTTVDYYSISGNDLILTHEKYYGRNFDAADSLRDWKLINVDMADCDPKKLSRLIHDREINEIKIIEIKNGKKLIFYGETEVYIFKCEDIEQEIRGHSRKEIIDMLLGMEDEFTVVDSQISKTREFLTRLARFISGESADHKRLFALHQEKNNLQATKSMHFLEILSRVKDKLDDLEKDLQNDEREYYKRHPELEQEMGIWTGD